MFANTDNILGVPQMTVQLTLADYRKFLGQDLTNGPISYMPYPGQVVKATDPIYGEGFFTLAYGLAGLQVGEAVAFGAAYAVTRAAAATRGVIGISMSANTDPTALSWYSIQGQVPARLLAGTALPLYSSITAGSLTTTVTAGQAAVGAFCLTALAANISTTLKINAVNGSTVVQVSDLAGMYVGAALTGFTGITNGTTITSIGQGGTFGGAQGNQNYQITLSAACTSTASSTGTLLHGAAFATAMLQYPIIPGAV